MEVELSTLQDNDTWMLVPEPPGVNVIDGKWVFTIKQGISEGSNLHKARFVARGFTQCYGTDYEETYSPTTRFTTIRILLQKAASERMLIHQMDVKGAYVNAPIERDIYIKQPTGFVKYGENGEDLVCKLNKSLYGLKQSGRNWYNTLSEFLLCNNFVKNEMDPCAYSDNDAIIIFWVDDILIASASMDKVVEIKKMLSNRFKMDDRGELRWFLGIEFKRLDNSSYQVNQRRYVDTILRRFKMENCSPVQTPAENGLKLEQPTPADAQEFKEQNFNYRQAVGSLIYLMTATRPDICWITSKLSQYLERPGMQQLAACKRVFRYLQGTKDYKLNFQSSGIELVGYSDADWGNDLDDRRSTTGYLFMAGNSPISWNSRKQQSVALSSCEAEYMAMSESTKEAVYLRQLCQAMGCQLEAPTRIYCDNQSAIQLLTNVGKHHGRSKHIDIRYHFVRDHKDIIFLHVSSKENLSDFLTKPVSYSQLAKVVQKLHIAGIC